MNTSVSTRTSATSPTVPAGGVSRWRRTERGSQGHCRVVLVADVLVDRTPNHLSIVARAISEGRIDPLRRDR